MQIKAYFKYFFYLQCVQSVIYRVLSFFGGTGKYSISWQHKHNHFISSKHTETITSIASMPNCRSPYTVLQGPLWLNVLTMCFYCYGERQRVDCHMPPAALASMAVLCLSTTWKHSWVSSNSILWGNKKRQNAAEVESVWEWRFYWFYCICQGRRWLTQTMNRCPDSFLSPDLSLRLLLTWF